MEEIINFPKLVDSEINSNIVTLDNNLKTVKERISKVNLTIMKGNNLENISSLCDYPDLVNINYKLKSAISQIEESIKHINK
jgi:hypothetical protein